MHNADIDNSNNKPVVPSLATTLVATEGKKEQQECSHKGKNSRSKKIEETEELDNEHLKKEIKSKIKEEFEKSKREQQILLKDNKETIIDSLLGNKESIRIEDLKIYEPIYKCYRQKGHCYICNTLTNIICISCKNTYHYNIKEVWLCTNNWQHHLEEKHNKNNQNLKL